jgi:hypothetical protein
MICYTEMPIHHFVIPVACHSYAVIRADIEGYINYWIIEIERKV